MDVKIEKSWKKELEQEFQKDYFVSLTDFIRNEYLTKVVYPKPENLFKAFDYCPVADVRVVILGQDPYHGQGQAHGLCFSVQKGIMTPPSLKNIFKELKDDVGVDIPGCGDLSLWAKQGVFLLNATLTVLAGQAGSHQKKGWEEFTDSVIKILSERGENIVFLLWGAYAQGKAQFIDGNKHLILKAPHPSPLSAHNGFFGCKHFSKTNKYLSDNNYPEIDWGQFPC